MECSRLFFLNTFAERRNFMDDREFLLDRMLPGECYTLDELESLTEFNRLRLLTLLLGLLHEGCIESRSAGNGAAYVNVYGKRVVERYFTSAFFELF